MTGNRRTFIRTTAATLAAGVAAGGVQAADQTPGKAASASADAPKAATQCLDYGLSFIGNSASFNTVRFWVESRTTWYDDEAGTSAVFYQCGSCKSENTFGEKDLLLKDNYDFLPILGGTDWLIYRRRCGITDTYRQIQPEVWGKPILQLRYGQGVVELKSFEEIRDATAAARPIVTQTELRNDELKLRAVIECPVKTMNISLDKSMYQVDTGPIAYPDLSKRFDPPLDCVRLAFVVFNAPDFADFVIEQPTPVMDGEMKLAEVYHYSQPFSMAARNRVFALSSPE